MDSCTINTQMIECNERRRKSDAGSFCSATSWINHVDNFDTCLYDIVLLSINSMSQSYRPHLFCDACLIQQNSRFFFWLLNIFCQLPTPWTWKWNPPDTRNWYHNSIAIHTKIGINIPIMTSQWRHNHGRALKITGQHWKKKIKFRWKDLNIRISPGFLAYKRRKWHL